jgi:uncharacterized protein (DUF3084 family)
MDIPAATAPGFLIDVVSRNGLIQADRLSAALRATRTELAAASGVSRFPLPILHPELEVKRP